MQIKDCGGITKIESDYELRAGNEFKTSTDGEESWIRGMSDRTSKIPKNNDPENTNCVAVPSTVVNEESILKQFPEVRGERYCAHDGFYRYKANYAHLNSLLQDGIIDVSNFSIIFFSKYFTECIDTDLISEYIFKPFIVFNANRLSKSSGTQTVSNDKTK